MRTRFVMAAAFVLLASACKEEEQQVVYQALPVETRDIVVSAQAAGTIQPDTTVEVKSRASGEVMQILAETGELVNRGDLLVRIERRIPQNTLAQAQAELEVARAQQANALSQKRRADELFKTQAITEQEHETATLAYANARASVVRSQVAVENAKIQLDDSDVRAPEERPIRQALVPTTEAVETRRLHWRSAISLIFAAASVTKSTEAS